MSGARGEGSAHQADIAVVGAGVMGLWTAWTLRERGHDVLLVDAWPAGHPRASSSGESRVIRCGYGGSSFYAAWAWRATKLWEAWQTRHGERLFHRTGVLWMAPKGDAYAAASLSDLERLRIPCERIEPAALQERYPQISFKGIRWGLLEPEAGAMQARRACIALARAFEEEGGLFICARVRPGTTRRGALLDVRAERGPRGTYPGESRTGREGSVTLADPETTVRTHPGGAHASPQRSAAHADPETTEVTQHHGLRPARRGSATSSTLEPTDASHSRESRTGQRTAADPGLCGRIEARTFIFACGPWLPALFPDLLARKVKVTRKEVFFFGTPPGDERFTAEAMPVWLELGTGCYGIPSLDGRGFKVHPDVPGRRVDPDTQDRRTSPRLLSLARACLRRRFPALARAPVVETRVCQYASTADDHLVFDRHPAWRNVWIVGAGSGHAFKHGPVIGEMVADVVTGEHGAGTIPGHLRLSHEPSGRNF